METNIIRSYHDDVGHVGIDKTYKLIKRLYYFPKMKEKIKQHISICLKCIVYQAKDGRKEGSLHNIDKGTKPFDTLHFDHYGPLPTTNKRNQYIFLVVDAFTKFTKLYPTRTTNTKEVIHILRSYFDTYSPPIKIYN